MMNFGGKTDMLKLIRDWKMDTLSNCKKIEIRKRFRQLNESFFIVVCFWGGGGGTFFINILLINVSI